VPQKREIIKPGWLIFGEASRKKIATLKPTKSGKREEEEICSWYRTACDQYRYPGTLHEWFYLLGWRGRR